MELNVLLDQIRTREAAATPGPLIVFNMEDAGHNCDDGDGRWQVWREDTAPYHGSVLEVSHNAHEEGQSDEAARQGAVAQAKVTGNQRGARERADAEFFAGARTDVPALLAIIDAMLKATDIIPIETRDLAGTARAAGFRKAMAAVRAAAEHARAQVTEPPAGTAQPVPQE